MEIDGECTRNLRCLFVRISDGSLVPLNC